MTAFTSNGFECALLPIFIDGEYLTSAGETMPSYDPATGQEWCQLADCTTGEVNAAVTAAKSAMLKPEWRDMTQSARGVLMLRLAELVAAQQPACANRVSDGCAELACNGTCRHHKGQPWCDGPITSIKPATSAVEVKYGKSGIIRMKNPT